MKAAFYTLGCKVNQYETEYMAELLQNAGITIVDHKQAADYYIVNSCTVTATADQKTRQAVRRLKRAHPNAVVLLTGCMPQAFPAEAEALTQADIVFSNKNDGDILQYINRYQIENRRIIDVQAHQTGDAFGKCAISRFSERIRAFVKIEDGCDRFCSYCIIPKSRGRVRSKAPQDLQAEVKTLAENGMKEIVLVGINLSAYGKGEDFDLTDAVRLCAETPGIERVRLGSLEPDHITEEMLARLAEIEAFCPQFHLSLQSGCNKTLKSMNRHYTAEAYKALCGSIRRSFPDAVITTDVIVGFCGESEADFSESLAFVQEMRFEKVHVFPYSERTGTAASKRENGDDVPKQEKERRAAKMLAACERIRKAYMSDLCGKTVQVLFESRVGDALYQGYTRGYIPVRLASDTNCIGQTLDVRITGCTDDYCIAE